MKIWTVDAFTDRMFCGNAAAVCMVQDFLPESLALQIASEMNLSETAFVKRIGNSHFYIRWFTPKREVKLCGHATLAAGHIIWQEGISNADKLQFESIGGSLSVSKDSKGITLDLPTEQNLTIVKNFAHIECALGIPLLSATSVTDGIIALLDSENAVYTLNPDPRKLLELDYCDIIVTAKAKKDYDFISRVFAPRDGIDEDPVTGSAHCKLAPFRRNRLRKNEFKAYQASKRGGALTLKLISDRTLITGQAVTVLTGYLAI